MTEAPLEDANRAGDAQASPAPDADPGQATGNQLPATSPPVEHPPADHGEPSAGSRAFLAAVRKTAGWRVSPRQLQAALAMLAPSEPGPNPERVAELLTASRGPQSQRQRRHAELWRAFGIALARQGQPSDPDAQRRFIGQAREAAGRPLGDAFLITVALELAALDTPLEPKTAGVAARRVRKAVGRAASLDQIADAVPVAQRTAASSPDDEQPASPRRTAPSRGPGRRPRSR